MADMPRPRIYTPGDGRVSRQGTSLLYIAGEKTGASVPWGIKKRSCIARAFFSWHRGLRREDQLSVFAVGAGEGKAVQIPGDGGIPVVCPAEGGLLIPGENDHADSDFC